MVDGCLVGCSMKWVRGSLGVRMGTTEVCGRFGFTVGGARAMPPAAAGKGQRFDGNYLRDCVSDDC